MEKIDFLPHVLQIGVKAGLNQEQTGLAISRISRFWSAISSNSQCSPRLASGISKNAADNPMLLSWALRVAASVSDRVFEKFCDNFVTRNVFDRIDTVIRFKKELGYHPPSTLVINPTMRCNLRCRGCYAYSYHKGADMDRSLLERVVAEARELGIRFITVTGGEPFLYQGIEDLFEKFSDIIFMVYTNAQFIDEERSARLARLGNVWPTVSVDGFQEETDDRRGQGVYARLIAAMELMREQGVMFGISAVPTRKNTELLASDDFIDHFIARGALFGWMFTYLPVGKDPDTQLMATPLQRDLLRRQGLHWRRTRPFFMADFWNDGPLCGGCMSASRFAFITSDGWVQPCTFVHFATHNVREHSLREIFDSEFFRTIRDRQPYHPNLLRPCKIIDHPRVLREVVKICRAHPTYPGAEQILKDPELVHFLDEYQKEYGAIADAAWASPDYGSGHCVLVPFFGRVDLYDIYGPRLKNAYRQLSAPVMLPSPETVREALSS